MAAKKLEAGDQGGYRIEMDRWPVAITRLSESLTLEECQSYLGGCKLLFGHRQQFVHMIVAPPRLRAMTGDVLRLKRRWMKDHGPLFARYCAGVVIVTEPLHPALRMVSELVVALVSTASIPYALHSSEAAGLAGAQDMLRGAR
ncbi:MAG: hypothetical protein MO852_17360, partial [Candidatus Devosia euplotis]|nr:hypothetical protein [Candidatus Devosia euplotis]